MNARRGAGRRKENNEAPAWFKPEAYAAAREMDAADWYLNLSLRRVVQRTDDKFLARFIRDHALIRRRDDTALMFWAEACEFGPDFTAILFGRAPRCGVWALRGDELYAFEKSLPSHVREFGAAFVPGETPSQVEPPGFGGPIDHLFEKPFASTFLRVDLLLPDKVLLDDMRRFLQAKRAELALLGGLQPYRQALDAIERRNDPKPTVWANRKLLQIIDIDHWRKSTPSKFADAEIARLLGIDDNDFRQARRDAGQLLSPFVLDSWLLPLARIAAPADPEDSP